MALKFPPPIPTARPRSWICFPAALIDRVEVRKSFTPDQLGNSTGGSVDIVTRSFPEKFVFSASAGVSYNTQANLNDAFASAKGGSTDFAGFDDGTRASAVRIGALPSSWQRPAPSRVRKWTGSRARLNCNSSRP